MSNSYVTKERAAAMFTGSHNHDGSLLHYVSNKYNTTTIQTKCNVLLHLP